MEKIKQLWAEWKVSLSFVGGALVIATAYGTCTVDPTPPEEVKSETVEEVQPLPAEEEPKPTETE